MVSCMAERAFPFNSSATQAVLDQFCHETPAPSQSPVAVVLLWKPWWRGWKKEKKIKSSDGTWSPQQGVPPGHGGPQARSSFSWHRPSPGSAVTRAAGGFLPRGTPSIPCICRPAAKPAPAACQGLAIWTGTDFVLERAPSPQSCLPRVTGCNSSSGSVHSPRSQCSKTRMLRNAARWADCAASVQLWKTSTFDQKKG